MSIYAEMRERVEECIDLMQDLDIKSTLPNMNKISRSLLNLDDVHKKLKAMEEDADAADSK